MRLRNADTEKKYNSSDKQRPVLSSKLLCINCQHQTSVVYFMVNKQIYNVSHDNSVSAYYEQLLCVG